MTKENLTYISFKIILKKYAKSIVYIVSNKEFDYNGTTNQETFSYVQ